MENINRIVAGNLKRLREEAGFSLEKTAERTGVSKTMLCQIEQAQSSPTLNTLYKIAAAFHITLSELVSSTQPTPTIINKNELAPVADEGGSMCVYTLFPADRQKRFEIFWGEIAPGGQSSVRTHEAGVQEHLTVFAGTLTLRHGDTSYTVPAQHAIHFFADEAHRYENNGSVPVVFCNTIYNP